MYGAIIQTQIKIVCFPYFIPLCRDDNERFDSLWNHQGTSVQKCSQHIMKESLPSCTIQSGKFLYNISIIIFLIEESGCECYDQKYIIMSHLKDSSRLIMIFREDNY